MQYDMKCIRTGFFVLLEWFLYLILLYNYVMLDVNIPNAASNCSVVIVESSFIWIYVFFPLMLVMNIGTALFVGEALMDIYQLKLWF